MGFCQCFRAADVCRGAEVAVWRSDRVPGRTAVLPGGQERGCSAVCSR